MNDGDRRITRRVFAGLTFILLMVATLTTMGCLGGNEDDDDRIQLVASIYPLGLFAREIGGDMVKVTTLIPENTELHGWQPGVSDILDADDADILVYNGAGLDTWFHEDILDAIDIGDALVIDTTHDMDFDSVSVVYHDDEGNDTTDEHGNDTTTLDDDHEEDGHDHDHGGLDPHTWVSPYLAMLQAQEIYEALVEKDPGNEANYTHNWESLKERLQGIDGNYTSGLENRTSNEIFLSHAAFGHLSSRYGFHQHGVIGLSADEQPSTTTLADLVDLMVEENVSVIFVDPIYSDQYVQTLKVDLEDRTGGDVTILKLYFMLGPVDGLDYFEQLEANLEHLQVGLGVTGVSPDDR